MKKLTIDVLIILFGGFIIAATGHLTVFGPGIRQPNEISIDIDKLPDLVQETLEKDYTDWNPAEAIIDSDGNGIFYDVKMNNRVRQETKTVRISIDGNVISEEHKPESIRRQKSRGRVWYV